MKTAIILAGTNIGGTERLALNICKNRHNKDFKPLIITTRKGELFAEFSAICQVYHIERRYNFDPLYFIKLINIIRLENVEILHTHQIIECFYVFLANLFLKKKIFLTYHGLFYLHGFFPMIMGYFLRKHLNNNIFVSSYLMSYYRNKYNFQKSKTSVIYNAVHIPIQKFNKSQLANEVKVPEDSIILGMIANFGSARDHLLVCKAFKMLIDDNNLNVHLIFIGREDTQYDESYQKVKDYCSLNKLNNRIHFLGSKKNATDYLYLFDIFLYASNRETFCISIVEAMMAGVPVVANDLPAIKEITGNGKYANLYKTGCVENFASAILKVIQSIYSQKQAALSTVSIIRDKYSVDAHVDSLMRIYKNC